MTVKTSISLTDAQEAYARELVDKGKYSSLSAVLQQGLELLRTQVETEEAELAALRALLRRRRQGSFESIEHGKSRTRAMIAKKKAGA